MANFLYTLSHSPIDAYFTKNSRDFIVREVPLYDFSGDGEHCVICLQKKDLTTFDALHILSEHLGVKIRDFGYAGLKDKDGLTSQFISFPAKFAADIKNFSHEKIKILSITKHKNKLKIGHLKGNNFFIRLKKVSQIDAQKIQAALQTIANQGFANYFGYQRFGKFSDNFEQGEKILKGEKKFKNPKMRNFLISAFQSKLFNKYLEKRVEISKMAGEFSGAQLAKIYDLQVDEVSSIMNQKQFFKILNGDILGHFPHGKFFVCENLDDEVQRFLRREISPSGLLLGNIKLKSQMLSARFENEIYEKFYAYSPQLNGTFRYLWSFIENVSCIYDEQNAQLNLEFYPPKGSYATVILEEILHKEINEI